MPKITIKRKFVNTKSITGQLYVNDNYICDTLELPDNYNKNDISSIPTGNYKASIRTDKNKWRIELIDVPGVPPKKRENIQIHIGNEPNEIKGCILVGLKAKPEENFISDSGKALKLLQRALGDVGLKDSYENNRSTPESPEIEVEILPDYLTKSLAHEKHTQFDPLSGGPKSKNADKTEKEDSIVFDESKALISIEISDAVISKYGKLVDEYFSLIVNDVSRNNIKNFALRLIQVNQTNEKATIPDNILRDNFNKSTIVLISMMAEAAEARGKDKEPVDKQGYEILAKLFRLWFTKKAYTIENKSNPNYSAIEIILGEDVGITVDWTLNFKSAQECFKIFCENEAHLMTPNAIKRISELFFSDPSLTNCKIGDEFWHDVVAETGEYGNVIKKHGKQIQFNSHEDVKWYDGICAALYKFAFYAVVAGRISHIIEDEKTKKIIEVKVVIDKLAIYLRDTFDFTDERINFFSKLRTLPVPPFVTSTQKSLDFNKPQYLGKWNNQNKTDKYQHLFNSDFRNYRDKINFGGDFFLFTKNKEVKYPDQRKWQVYEVTLRRP